MSGKWKRMLWILVAVVLAVIASLALQVEDWGRDLSINYAATSPDAADESLRTLETAASVNEVLAAVEQFASESSMWSLTEVDEEVTEPQTLRLVRTTRLFRFQDDVTVQLQVTDAGTCVDVTSQSRVGKGDLGQNPRNIRELLSSLRRILAAGD